MASFNLRKAIFSILFCFIYLIASILLLKRRRSLISHFFISSPVGLSGLTPQLSGPQWKITKSQWRRKYKKGGDGESKQHLQVKEELMEGGGGEWFHFFIPLLCRVDGAEVEDEPDLQRVSSFLLLTYLFF